MHNDIKIFIPAGVTVVPEKLEQRHKWNNIQPSLSWYLSISQKDNGCACGRKQLDYTSKEDPKFPAILIASQMLFYLIEFVSENS